MSKITNGHFIKNFKRRIYKSAPKTKPFTDGRFIVSVLFAAAGVLITTDVTILKLQDYLAAGTNIGVAEAQEKSMEDVDNMEATNKDIVREGFDKWANGTGSFFDLLTEDAEWTITGRSPISKTYTSRRQFLDEAIAPINERLSVKIVPTVRGIYADGDVVIALWDGTATAKDGKPYKNTYSWYMTMKDGWIVRVVAFFDTIELTELWERIPVNK